MQTSQKQYADRQRRDHSVAVGDQVLLVTRNLNLSHLPSKLLPRFCGPFLVEAQVTPVTFRLRLPDTWKLHNAFHVQLLKPYKDPNQQFQGRQLPPPPPVLVQDEPEYEVERVLTHRRRGGKTLEFLLRWKGYDPTEDSWVVEADMGNARRALKEYLVKQGLPPLPPSPAPPCLPCVKGRQLAAPDSSSFPPTNAPLQTLHMDVWGPARGEVLDVLILRIRAVRLQLRERLRANLHVLRLHSDRGGEFSSDLLRDFCCGEGILQSFTLPASPQQSWIAERRIGLVLEVASTSTIHADAPHCLWPFVVRYAAHQLNLRPRVSLLKTSPTLRWTGEVGDASVFRVWGSHAFVRDTSTDKLSARTVPCVFLGFPPDAIGWHFYHPTSRRVFPSQDVTFDESVPFYRLFPYRYAPPPPPPLFLAPDPPPVDSLPPQGPTPSGVSQLDPVPRTAPVEVAVDSGAARGAASEGAASGGAEPGGAEAEGAACGGAEPGDAEPGGAEPKSVECGFAEYEGAEPGGAEPQGTASSGGSAGASP
ncbi:unnamed protein product [Closterium sp. NIES-53]